MALLSTLYIGLTNGVPVGTRWRPHMGCPSRPVQEIAQLVELRLKFNVIQPYNVIVDKY